MHHPPDPLPPTTLLIPFSSQPPHLLLPHRPRLLHLPSLSLSNAQLLHLAGCDAPSPQTHNPVAGARPRRLPFHAVSVRPRRSAVSSVSVSSPQQAPGPGDNDDANEPTGVPMPLSRESAIPLPRPLTSADLMGEDRGEGLRLSLFLVGSLATNC